MKKLVSISALGGVKYRIGIAGDGDFPTVREFDFEVQEGDIDVLPAPKEFSEYVSHNLANLSSLFEAIMQFHRATKVQLP